MYINIGFPALEHTAPANRRYVGCYYYESYWQQWVYVHDVNSVQGTFTVQTVHMNGDLDHDAKVRTHRTPMHSNHFANKPFDVRQVM